MVFLAPELRVAAGALLAAFVVRPLVYLVAWAVWHLGGPPVVLETLWSFWTTEF